ncbi:Phenylalanyl-tRNA synthetase beta chain [Candidatus Johnevansia muelleri]|uniref:Phenylalanine--tRNA ligase beta subunit n=1 Tax=Candidatus Johnevansia muelleri TaxID=1495769 RepID=A0A078KB89_9GAMM|nr:Phenylalanyl-tRNA synthetase beta chain [Candidatus Evansia muelleri]
MKISEQWLREFVYPKLYTHELANQITIAGLEVTTIETKLALFSGVVIACIININRHPKVNKLNIYKLYDGKIVHKVVCHRYKISQGNNIAFAPLGSFIFKNFRVIKRKIHGVESYGIICRPYELGLETSYKEIIILPKKAIVGVDIRNWIKLDDVIIDVDLTPNRGDCLSLRGFARELGVLNRIPVKFLNFENVHIHNSRVYPININNPKDCPCLVTRVIENIDFNTITPLWMQYRLNNIGILSINIIDDIINYVMLELGQPINTFDIDTINGKLNIRMAHIGESLQLVNGSHIYLRDDTLVSTDKNHLLEITGIIKSKFSNISMDGNTRNILLKSEFLNPLSLTGQARYYNLYTNSSQRFERGVDSTLQHIAIERATKLIIDITGGKAGPITSIQYEVYFPCKRKIELSDKKIEKLLGTHIKTHEIETIISLLGIKIKHKIDCIWNVEVPHWRFDINNVPDLIEELARIYGYSNLISKINIFSISRMELKKNLSCIDICKQLITREYNEVITYSFISSELQYMFDPYVAALKIYNPINKDMSVMRTSLWPGLITTFIYNKNRHKTSIALFEKGMVFIGDNAQYVKQIKKIGGILTGTRYSIWTSHSENLDFLDIKGDVESILHIGGNIESWYFEYVEHPALHPGKSAKILYIDKDGTFNNTVGWIGAIHPDIATALNINFEVFLFELDIDLILTRKSIKVKKISRFPETSRDLSLIVKQEIPIIILIDSIRSISGDWLTDIKFFDIYQGHGIKFGYKSITFSLTWQHPFRTLYDKDIEKIMLNIINYLNKNHEVTIRN